MNLFKTSKAKETYKVECLNAQKGITSSLRICDEQRKHVVCLCIQGKTKVTNFLNKFSAIEQMKKYRQLYKEKKLNTL